MAQAFFPMKRSLLYNKYLYETGRDFRRVLSCCGQELFQVAFPSDLYLISSGMIDATTIKISN